MTLFSMLGSVFSGRRDYTRVPQREPVQTEPYISDVPGFNTRFSPSDLDSKEQRGVELTPDELKFLNYVRSL